MSQQVQSSSKFDQAIKPGHPGTSIFATDCGILSLFEAFFKLFFFACPDTFTLSRSVTEIPV